METTNVKADMKIAMSFSLPISMKNDLFAISLAERRKQSAIVEKAITNYINQFKGTLQHVN